MLVTFEGGDGSGKSTHIAFLERVLEGLGLDVVRVREPGGTPLGEKLRSILLDPENLGMSDRSELLIYEAARAQLVDDVIKPALERGAVVLCDRFTDSTVVYQGLGRGIGVDAVQRLNAFATCGIEPDVTIVFECRDRAERIKRVDERGARDRLERSGEDFLIAVADGFDDLASSPSPRIRRLSTSQTHSQTASALFALLGDVMPFMSDGSVDFGEELAGFDAEHARSRTSGNAGQSQ